MSLKVYIGHDSREEQALAVATSTLKRTSGIEPEILRCKELQDRGLLTRAVDRRGKMYDLVSNAPQSTDFAISRFLVPMLCQDGWALFTDCDVVFMRDVNKLLDLADPRYAVQVVKHNYTPSSASKMDDQVQTIYSRKNWSSVCLWNVNHPANRRLTLHDVNTRRGLWLHQFGWLHDDEIGDLPSRWNILIGEQEIPEAPAILHYTLGVPVIAGREGSDGAEIWLRAQAEL